MPPLRRPRNCVVVLRPEILYSLASESHEHDPESAGLMSGALMQLAENAMISPPGNDRPLIGTYPWLHLLWAAGAWMWLWFCLWALSIGVTTSVIVALSSVWIDYTFLPWLILGSFATWAASLVHIQKRIRNGRNPSLPIFIAGLLLTPTWPPLCFWSSKLLHVSALKPETSPVSVLLLRLIDLRTPYILALLITLGFGLLINIQVAHKLFNRTAEPLISTVLFSYPLAIIPAFLAQVYSGTFAAMGVFGATANGLAIFWYRLKLKKEVANHASPCAPQSARR